MFKLHDYQRELVNKARDKLKVNNGVLVVSPAGSGKSVVIAEIARLTTLKQNNVLFIVHRKELAEQIEQTFNKNEVDMNFVTIMTVGKAVNRLGELPEPSLIITDETHHSRAKSYLKIYEFYDKAYRLGFTASPWRMNGKGFKDVYDTMIEGPDVQWLIDNGFLAPFRYFAPNLADLSKLKKSSTGDYSKKSMDEAIEKAVFGDVVTHYQKLADGQQAILYAHSVEASKQLAESFKSQNINAVHADSKTNKLEREKIMSDFKSGNIKVLCNVDLISEGFDVPDCTVVILVRPTASLVLHIQQSMRSMRFKPNKTATIIDHVNNYKLHGLPNVDREWAIEDRKKQKKKQTGEIATTECPSCFAVIQTNVKSCPMCGEKIETQANEPKELENVNAELIEVNQEKFKVDYSKIRLTRKYLKKSKDDLETLEDYYLFAKARGYKDGWLKFNVQELKQLNWPQFYSKIKTLKNKYEGAI